MKKIYATILVVLSGLGSYAAPPDYSFKSPTLLSGTALQVGARYRFSNVRAGTDAIVTIVQYTGGVTLTSVDDGSAGYADAFQPYVVSPANSNGYAEFLVEFVNTGTLVPRVMTEVPITPIDVDGDAFAPAPLYEFDMVTINPGGYYIDFDMLGAELNISVAANWVTGRNTAAVNYSGIDTAKKNVMFSVVNSNISSFSMRLGAQNGSNASNNRRKSIYFSKFTFPNSMLARKSLLSFSGIEKNKTIDLKWQFDTDNLLHTVTLEKSVASNEFTPVMIMLVNSENNNKVDFSYQDKVNSDKAHLYRLKMTGADGKFQYSSILTFHVNKNRPGQLRIYPTVFKSSTTLNVKTQSSGTAFFQLIDYSGKVLLQRNLPYGNGTNNIPVDNLESVGKGYYIASLKIGGVCYSQQVYKQ